MAFLEPKTAKFSIKGGYDNSHLVTEWDAWRHEASGSYALATLPHVQQKRDLKRNIQLTQIRIIIWSHYLIWSIWKLHVVKGVGVNGHFWVPAVLPGLYLVLSCYFIAFLVGVFIIHLTEEEQRLGEENYPWKTGLSPEGSCCASCTAGHSGPLTPKHIPFLIYTQFTSSLDPWPWTKWPPPEWTLRIGLNA